MCITGSDTASKQQQQRTDMFWPVSKTLSFLLLKTGHGEDFLHCPAAGSHPLGCWLARVSEEKAWQLSLGEGEDGPTSVCTARILYVLCRNRNSPRGSCLQEAPCLERNEDTWTCHQDQTSSFQNPSQRDLDTGKLTFYYNVLDRRREPFVLPRASDTRSLHCSLCEISFFKIGLKVI